MNDNPGRSCWSEYTHYTADFAEACRFKGRSYSPSDQPVEFRSMSGGRLSRRRGGNGANGDSNQP